MPWTIWPSLVVLWGVCWMFYPPSNDWQTAFEEFGQYSELPAPGWLGNFDQVNPSDFALSTLPTHDTNHLQLQELLSTTEEYQPSLGWSFPYPEAMQSYEQHISTPGSGLSRPAPDAPSPSASGSDDSEDLLTCPGCGESFSRSDVCARHQRDSCPKMQQANSHHKYHCPYPPCTRSAPGRGFVRKDHVQQHLGYCAVYKQMQLKNGVPVEDQTDNGSAMHRTSSKRKATNDLPREGGRRPKLSHSAGKAGAMSELEKVYRRRMKSLEKKERDCQQERQELEELELMIKELQARKDDSRALD